MPDAEIKSWGKNGQYTQCEYEGSKMDALIVCLKEDVCGELKTLNASHDKVMKWLILTVCCLALGKGLAEVKDIFWPQATKLEARQ